MVPIILTGIVAYASTSMDCLILLTVLFGVHGKHAGRAIYLGDLLGTTLLLLISGLCAYPLRSLPQTTIMRILAIFPLLIGLRTWFHHQPEAPMNRLRGAQHGLPLTIAALIVSTGADNISVYIPLLTNTTASQIGVIIVTLYAMLTLFYWAARILAHLPYRYWLQRNGHYVTGVLYIFIGCSLLIKSFLH